MRNNQNQTLLNCLKVVAFVTLISVVSTLALLLMQQLQMNRSQPLLFSELEKMKEEARTDNQNLELQKKIRDLDLMSRQAWFTALAWRTKVVYLLAANLALLFISIWLIRRISPVQIDPKILTPDKPHPEKQTWALATIAAVSVIAVNGLLFWHHNPAATGKNAQQTIASAPGKNVTASTPKNSPSTAIADTKHLYQPADFSELEKNWTGFRGPLNDGRNLKARPVINWNIKENKGLKWKVEVPIPGYSSPVVFADRIFLTGGNEERRVVMAFSTIDGKLLWTYELSGIDGSPAKPPKVSQDTGYAASTPVTDGNLVYAIFATGDLVAVDYAGKPVWTRNLGVPENMYGYSSSLLYHDGRLIIQYDNQDKQVLYCLNAADGKEIWQNQRDTIISWSSPTLCRSEERLVIVITTCRDAEGFDFLTGKKLWQHAIMGGEVAPSATSDGNSTVFVTNENAVTAAINTLNGELLWETDAAIMPDVSSPVWHSDMLFIFTSGATVSCLDAKSGKLLWEKDLAEGFYSSPLLLTDRIIAFDLKGNMIVLKPDPKELVIEQTLPLHEPVVTTPAIVGNQMWVRTSTHLYCLSGEENGKN